MKVEGGEILSGIPSRGASIMPPHWTPRGRNLPYDPMEVNMPSEDKTGISELVWLYARHQAALPFAKSLHGWLSDVRHRGRRFREYCPFQCWICAEQRIIDNDEDAVQIGQTPTM